MLYYNSQLTYYCEIINFRWIFYFMYFVGRSIHEFMIATKYYSLSKIVYNLNSTKFHDQEI